MALPKEKTTFGDRIKAFDFYKDLPRDLAEPTVSGATSKKIRLISFSIDVCARTNGSSLCISNYQFSLILEDK